ncbi:hypothetical protein A33M_3352 [Rhodovulum sp. PH10]|uniref:hypothetical protein n=1 Tax=Rhodovulum sp. PH10 TaxID=1187851 RepID=UPI00027C293E|nr:hypothetical protein [Rhodovulum sp. PH10]EJW11274.1 hypothetical protein A33M_3352 [Rhodovulum sp. PH10]
MAFSVSNVSRVSAEFHDISRRDPYGLSSADAYRLTFINLRFAGDLGTFTPLMVSFNGEAGAAYARGLADAINAFNRSFFCEAEAEIAPAAAAE